MDKTYRLVVSLLKQKLPSLHRHLFTSEENTNLGLHPHQILEPMIRTLFLGPGPGLGIEIGVRLWDVMMFEGDAVIIRSVVAVLKVLESGLYGTHDEVLGKLGWRSGPETFECFKVMGSDRFMGEVRSAGKEQSDR